MTTLHPQPTNIWYNDYTTSTLQPTNIENSECYTSVRIHPRVNQTDEQHKYKTEPMKSINALTINPRQFY
jgi:hypothetical protein